MKKFTLLLGIIFTGFLQASAQCSICTPAFVNCPPTGGLCNRLDTAYANHPYDKIINFYMPKTLTNPTVLAQCQCSQVQLREIDVTGVSGLPGGINWTISNNGHFNVQNGDSIGCAHFCGTPLVPGLYSVAVYLLADVTAIGTPIGNVNQDDVVQQYFDTLLVLPDTSGGVASFTFGNNGFSACDSITVDLNAVFTAPAPNMTRYFWNIAGQPSQAKTPGVFTFRNVSQTKADTFPVTLTTVFYKYRIKSVNMQLTGGWYPDINEASAVQAPEPYLRIPVLGYQSHSCSNTAPSTTSPSFTNINQEIPEGTTTVHMEVWDDDNCGLIPIFASPDDLMDNYDINVVLGNQALFPNQNNSTGALVIDTVPGTVVTETLNVIVNPYPAFPTVMASQDTFCQRDSIRISVDNTYNGYSFEWYRDTVFLTTATDSFFFTDQAGNYKVKVTNLLSGCQSESNWKTITKMQSPAANIAILFNGTQLFISPFPATGFTAEWYYNGALLPGETGKFLTPPGNGEYQAVLYNTAFPSCRSVSAPDSIVSGLRDITNNSIYGLNVFPNPNIGAFTLKFESAEENNISVLVQNTMGQQVWKRRLENFTGTFTEFINLSDAGKGMYLISIETETGRVNTRVAVQ